MLKTDKTIDRKLSLDFYLHRPQSKTKAAYLQ